ETEPGAHTGEPLGVSAHRDVGTNARNPACGYKGADGAMVGQRGPGEVSLDASHPGGSKLPIVAGLQTADATQGRVTAAVDVKRGQSAVRIEERPVRRGLPCSTAMDTNVEACPARSWRWRRRGLNCKLRCRSCLTDAQRHGSADQYTNSNSLHDQ